MKILKFELGGYTAPLLTYNPVTVTRPTTATDEEEAESSGSSTDITDKDLLKMLLKLDGLPNDMAAITKQLQKFYFNELYGLFPNTQGIASRYLSALHMMKKANFSKDSYDKAFEIIKNNGGLNEIAINELGKVFCKSEDGDFQLLSLEDLKDSKYKPLTNALLLLQRAYDPDMVGLDSLTDIISHGIGMDAVNKFIHDAIKKLGTDTLKLEGYSSVSLDKIIKGLEYLLEASEAAGEDLTNHLSVDGIYNTGVLSKTQAQQAKAALNYLYNTLPNNMKTLLKYKAMQSGDTSKLGALKLLTNLIVSETSSTNTIDINGKNGSTNKKETKTTTDPLLDKLSMSPVMMMQAGYSDREVVTLNPGTSYSFTVNALVLPITKKDGTSLGTKTTLADVAETPYSGALNFSNVSMGGLHISLGAFLDVLVDATNFYVMCVPYDKEEYAKTRRFQPDIRALKRIEAADAEVRNSNLDMQNPTPETIEKINQIYVKHGLPVLMDDQGNLIVKDYMKFGVLNANALDIAFGSGMSAFDIDAECIRDDEYAIQNVLDIINHERGDKNHAKFNAPNGWQRFFNTGHSMYRGTIFIPVRDNQLNGIISSGGGATPNQLKQIEAANQQRARLDSLGGYHDATKDFE